MHRRLTAAALAAAALLALTACSSNDSSSSKPDVAACKTAMEKQFKDAMKTGATGSQPAECVGVDNATLQRLAGEITASALGATPTP